MGFQAKRDYMDVCGEILRICLSPTMKSRIMQRANLGHRMFTRYLNYLSGTGLLEEVGGLYRTTEKGLRFLSRLTSLESLLIEA